MSPSASLEEETKMAYAWFLSFFRGLRSWLGWEVSTIDSQMVPFNK